MPKYLIPLLVGLTIVLPAHAAKGYHLWYDENGQAVYSQFAPDDGTPVQTVKPPRTFSKTSRCPRKKPPRPATRRHSKSSAARRRAGIYRS